MTNPSKRLADEESPNEIVFSEFITKNLEGNKYYRKFRHKNEVYEVGDFFVILTPTGDLRIGRIREIYYDHREQDNFKNRVIIEKFIKSNCLHHHKLFLDLDIVQYENLNVLDIPINLIHKKCSVVFATIDDDPRQYQVLHVNGQSDIIYVCRCWMSSDGELNPSTGDRFPIDANNQDNIIILDSDSDSTEESQNDDSSVIIEEGNASFENDQTPTKKAEKYKVTSVEDSDNTVKLTLTKLPAHLSPTVLVEKLDLSKLHISTPKTKKEDRSSDFAERLEMSNTKLSQRALKQGTDTPRRSSRCTSRVDYCDMIYNKHSRISLPHLHFDQSDDNKETKSPKKRNISSDDEEITNTTPRKKNLPNRKVETERSRRSCRKLDDSDSGEDSQRRSRRTCRKLDDSEGAEEGRKTRFSTSAKPLQKRTISVSEDEKTPRKKNTRAGKYNNTASPVRSRRNNDKKLYDSDDDKEELEEEMSFVDEITPKKHRQPKNNDDDDYFGKGKRTPGLRIKNLTPGVQSRICTVVLSENPFEQARRLLSNWSRTTRGSLPCREQEYSDIFQFVYKKLKDNSGGCMYISGVPGTGKTATVLSVMNELIEMINNADVDDFVFIKVNALSLTEPRQVYVQLVKEISGKTLQWQLALDYLIGHFTKTKKKKLVLLIDELDRLWTKKQDVVYNLLDLPSKSKTPVIILTIANTMDLPERILSNKVNSRLGLTRLTFKPYKHTQLLEIVKARLAENDLKHVFKDEALELVARKVAAISGDARRVLDICARATEIAACRDDLEVVDMTVVNAALQEMIATATMRAINSCSKLEKAILMSISNELSRTGNEEVPFGNMYNTLSSLMSLESMPMPSVSTVLSMCNRLASFRLLIKQHGRTSIESSLILNVSPDELNFSFQ